jgi:hypothetical protein
VAGTQSTVAQIIDGDSLCAACAMCCVCACVRVCACVYLHVSDLVCIYMRMYVCELCVRMCVLL